MGRLYLSPRMQHLLVEISAHTETAEGDFSSPTKVWNPPAPVSDIDVQLVGMLVSIGFVERSTRLATGVVSFAVTETGRVEAERLIEAGIVPRPS